MTGAPTAENKVCPTGLLGCCCDFSGTKCVVGNEGTGVYLPGEAPYLSEAESLAKAARASGKLGGVAGVLAGVHN